MLWLAKIGAKIVLSRLPATYTLWQRLGLFRHGAMDKATYAVSVFNRHAERLMPDAMPKGFVALELGPGDSIASAVLARMHGASAVYLVDTGSYVRRDVDVYRELAKYCETKGIKIPQDLDLSSFDALLDSSKTRYLTAGTTSLREIPDESVDAVWSQAVLEHIRLKEFPVLLAELFRVMKPNAVASHRVDLKDHLSGALNNLRFSEAVWESEFFASSGFYTNRIRYPQMIQMFKDAGFKVTVLQVDKWKKLPTPQRRMGDSFKRMHSEDLLIRGFDVLLRK